MVQVAERTLFLWNNEYIVNLIAQHRTAVLPTVFPALELNARSHWNPAVHGLTCNVRKMFQEMDPALYEECRRHFEDDQVRYCTSLSFRSVLEHVLLDLFKPFSKYKFSFSLDRQGSAYLTRYLIFTSSKTSQLQPFARVCKGAKLPCFLPTQSRPYTA